MGRKESLMTINELTNQIFSLTSGNIINGEKFTKAEFKRNVHHFFEEINFEKYIIMIVLPDGEWLCKITMFAKGEYDYLLPDTREQEDKLWAELGVKRTAKK